MICTICPTTTKCYGRFAYELIFKVQLLEMLPIIQKHDNIFSIIILISCSLRIIISPHINYYTISQDYT